MSCCGYAFLRRPPFHQPGLHDLHDRGSPRGLGIHPGCPQHRPGRQHRPEEPHHWRPARFRAPRPLLLQMDPHRRRPLLRSLQFPVLPRQPYHRHSGHPDGFFALQKPQLPPHPGPLVSDPICQSRSRFLCLGAAQSPRRLDMGRPAHLPFLPQPPLAAPSGPRPILRPLRRPLSQPDPLGPAARKTRPIAGRPDRFPADPPAPHLRHPARCQRRPPQNHRPPRRRHRPRRLGPAPRPPRRRFHLAELF